MMLRIIHFMFERKKKSFIIGFLEVTAQLKVFKSTFSQKKFQYADFQHIGFLKSEIVT